MKYANQKSEEDLSINNLYSGKFMRDSNLMDVIDQEVNKLANEVFFFCKFNSKKDIFLEVSRNDYTFSEKLFDDSMKYFVGYSKIVFVREKLDRIETLFDMDEKKLSIGLSVPPMERLNQNYNGISHFLHFYRMWGCADINECIYLIELYRKHKTRFKNLILDKRIETRNINIRNMFYNTIQLRPRPISMKQEEKFSRITSYLEDVIPEIFYLGANIK